MENKEKQNFEVFAVPKQTAYVLRQSGIDKTRDKEIDFKPYVADFNAGGLSVSSLQTLSIDCETIILNKKKDLDISFKLDVGKIENLDRITINGITFVREGIPE